MKTCIYLRKSRKDRADEPMEVTLQRHRDTLLAHAKKCALEIIEIKEEVVSGDSIAGRPEMQKLLDEVEDKKYEAVLVMDIDRLGRGNMIDQGIISQTFKESGTRILTPDKEYNLDDEMDEDFFDLASFFARKELKTIKKRLGRGKMKSVAEGNYIGANAPFGYRKVNKTLIPDENEAPVLQRIFDLYINGYGDTRIAKYLTGLSIPTRNGNTVWDRTSIRHIIRNPVYTGKIVWNKRKFTPSANSPGKRTSEFRPAEEWTVHEGKHPALITDDIFEQAQRLSQDRYTPHVHEKKAMRNPLSYIIKCGACGHTMTMRTASGKKDTLRCYHHCGGVKSSYIYLVEERLIEILYETLEKRIIEFDYNKQMGNLKTEIKALEHSIKNTEQEIEKLKAQQAKQYDLLEQGIYDTDTFLLRSQTISSSLDTAKDKIAETTKQIKILKGKSDKYYLMLPKIQDAISFIDSSYWGLNPQGKNDFLRSVIKEVVYWKSHDAEKEDFTLKISLKF